MILTWFLKYYESYIVFVAFLVMIFDINYHRRTKKKKELEEKDMENSQQRRNEKE